jgi:hypothetical protein
MREYALVAVACALGSGVGVLRTPSADSERPIGVRVTAEPPRPGPKPAALAGDEVVKNPTLPAPRPTQ